jgi:hypothetical protein
VPAPRETTSNKAIGFPIAIINSVGQGSRSKGRLRVDNWVVQGLYHNAVKESVELCLLTVL